MNDTNAKSRTRTHRSAVSGNRTNAATVGRNRLHTSGSLFDRPSPAMRALRKQAVTITHDARSMAGTAGAVAREQLDPVKNYVVDKPIQSLFLAAGVGLIFGLIFFRR